MSLDSQLKKPNTNTTLSLESKKLWQVVELLSQQHIDAYTTQLISQQTHTLEKNKNKGLRQHKPVFVGVYMHQLGLSCAIRQVIPKSALRHPNFPIQWFATLIFSKH